MHRSIRIFLSLIAAVLVICPCKTNAKPKRATYTNPVYNSDMPDPTVMHYQGFYYAFGTTGERRVDGRIFTLLRSTNLVNWEPLGGAMIPPSDNPRYAYWAPEITTVDGKFYLYYAMGGIEPERFQNRVAISTNPAGPYVDSGNVLVDCQSNRFTIDPYPFQDTDGQWYFYYSCNFTNEEPGVHIGTGIMVDRLIGMTNLAGDCHVVVRARYDWTLYEANRRMDVYNTNYDWHTIEGPCVLKHDGKYYCIYSGSSYRSTHYGLDYVVADKPLGPYTGQGATARVLHEVKGKVRGPGHNDVILGPDGHTQYVVYHAWDPGMNYRAMCVDKLVWTKDGPKCLGPTFTPQPVP